MDEKIIVLPVLFCVFFSPLLFCGQFGASDSGNAETQEPIDQNIIENYCLGKAKEIAGDDYIAYDCACVHKGLSELGSYHCNISSTEGKKAMRFSCVDSMGTCVIYTELGKETADFDSMRDYAQRIYNKSQ